MSEPKLSQFQVDKFSFLFTTLFGNEGKELDAGHVSSLVERMRVFSGWEREDKHFIMLNDVLHAFHECLIDHVEDERALDKEELDLNLSWKEAMSRPSSLKKTTTMTLNEWLSMWAKLCRGAAGLGDFPLWVQLLPSIFFSVIDNNHDGVLTKDEYKRFYSSFVGIAEDGDLDKTVNEGIRAMTANGDYPFDLAQFSFCFANFLLGRSIYGPGKYIFGNFDNSDIDQPFKVNYD